MPKIIRVNEMDASNKVELDTYNFIDMIESLEPPIILMDNDYFYITYNGFCYYTYHYGLFDSFQELKKKAIEAQKNGFSRIDLYESSKSFGDFENEEDYLQFSNGGFSPHYDDYQEAKQKGFSEYHNFREAKLIGIESFDEFQEFKQSPFYENTFSNRLFHSDVFTRKHIEINKRAYEEYQETKQIIQKNLKSRESLKNRENQ